jgi:hypothetical protein
VWQGEAVKLTSPLWYLAAVLLVLGGAMAGVVVAAGAWDEIREANVQPVTERVDASSGTLAVYTDIVQDDRGVRCTATGPGKKAEPTPIPRATIDIAVDDDGNVWHLIGLLKDGAKDVALACAPDDDKSDTASYGYAVVDGASRTNTGEGIAVLGTAAGLALAVYTFFCRSRRQRAAVPVGARR